MAEGDRKNSQLSASDKGSDFIFDLSCDPCNAEGNNVEAEGYCVDCEEYLCNNCYQGHLKPKPSRHHVLQDRNSMPKHLPKSPVKDICSEPCLQHKGRILECFCNTHHEYVCPVCVIMHHNNCKNVIFISDEAKTLTDRQEYTDTFKAIVNMRKTADKFIQTTQDNIKMANFCQSQAMTDFMQFRMDLNKALDELQTVITDKTGQIKQEDEQKMTLAYQKYSNIQSTLQTICSRFETLAKSEQFCQLFGAMKNAHREIPTLEKSLEITKDLLTVRNYKFKANGQMKQMMEQPKSIGQLDIETDGSCQTDLDKSEEGDASLPQESQEKLTKTSDRSEAVDPLSLPELDKTKEAAKISQINAVMGCIGDINPRASSDKRDCDLTGLVAIPNNRLVLADYANQKLKLIDTVKLDITAELCLIYYPWDVAQINSHQVVVTCPDNQMIIICDVGTSNMSVVREMDMSGECRGIACHSDKLIVTYFGHISEPGYIEIMKLDGTKLQKFDTLALKYPWYVAISLDQQTIYLSDRYRNEIISLTLTGQVKATYKDMDLTRPGKLAIDKTGRIFVCGIYPTTSIHLLSGDLKQSKIIPGTELGLEQPKIICYCQETGVIFVGSGESGDKHSDTANSAVKVFTLSHVDLPQTSKPKNFWNWF